MSIAGSTFRRLHTLLKMTHHGEECRWYGRGMRIENISFSSSRRCGGQRPGVVRSERKRSGRQEVDRPGRKKRGKEGGVEEWDLAEEIFHLIQDRLDDDVDEEEEQDLEGEMAKEIPCSSFVFLCCFLGYYYHLRIIFPCVRDCL